MKLASMMSAVASAIGGLAIFTLRVVNLSAININYCDGMIAPLGTASGGCGKIAHLPAGWAIVNYRRTIL
jgi:hypothetical protein